MMNLKIVIFKKLLIKQTFMIIIGNPKRPCMYMIDAINYICIIEHPHSRCIQKLKCYESVK